MDMQQTRIGGALVLAPRGRIDHDHADAFKAALEPFLADCKDAAGRIVLDMAGVDYISSVGLRVLVLAAKQVKQQKGRIVVAALTPLVREVFEISRFNLVFDLFDTVDAAIAGTAR